MKINLLLLQAREPGDPIRRHEVECFVEHLELEEERILPHDLLEGPPTMEMVRRTDGVLIGGSGDFYVSKGDLPEFAGFLDLLREVADAGHPMFASCFGYQALVHALGGEIIHDPDNTEVGTYDLSLTDEGREDPLLGTLPERFTAQMGHRDRAAAHPQGIANLASSARSPFQALRLPGKPIWATQFHPELKRESNVHRYRRYLDGYAAHMTDEERANALSGFGESPEASTLLRRFLHLVFD